MSYLEPLIKSFTQHADKEAAAKMSGYMKNKFAFYGIPNPKRKELQSAFVKEHGWPGKEASGKVLRELWSLPQREYRYFAIDILDKFQKCSEEKDIALFEKLITTDSWWDTVDTLATKPVGTYFKLYPDQIKPVTGKWMKSGNMWLQRVCILFQLKYKKTTATKLLSGFILELKDSKEFFIQKAIGWSLREYSKSDPGWVREFLRKNKLMPLSIREGSKYI